jgi:hypothetical protein
MFKNSPLIKAKDKDKREIYAFQFTGTDENISKIERTVQPLFEEFMISTHDKYCFFNGNPLSDINFGDTPPINILNT